jgi:hypothetical protein
VVSHRFLMTWQGHLCLTSKNVIIIARAVEYINRSVGVVRDEELKREEVKASHAQ